MGVGGLGKKRACGRHDPRRAAAPADRSWSPPSRSSWVRRSASRCRSWTCHPATSMVEPGCAATSFSVVKALSPAMPATADRTAEMGNDHAPGDKRRAAEIASQQRQRSWQWRRRPPWSGRARAGCRSANQAMSADRDQHDRGEAERGTMRGPGRANRRAASGPVGRSMRHSDQHKRDRADDHVEIRRPDRDLARPSPR